MDDIFFDLMEMLKVSSVTETFVDILLCAVPIWLAVMIGLIIGWTWRPRWTGLLYLGLRSKLRFLWTAPPGFGARRLWLAFTALSAFSVCRTLWTNFEFKPRKPDPVASSDGSPSTPSNGTRTEEKQQDVVTEDDLEQLLHLLEGGEKEWQCMMERSTPNMMYQAWRYEPETGPVTYRSRTVFEDATPEMVRDFFWDDEFRPKWDPMLSYFKTLQECPHTGTTVVQWIKKFPFFCSDREYIIGRRIWEAGKTYYCVTKGVQYPGIPARDKPRRVEQYFSSWVIRAVESRKGDGQQSACEVALVHHEDMGIPKDVAKLGVRHGMWGAVKKLNSGLRAYQNARKSDSTLSRSALMARITTKLSTNGNMDCLVRGEDDPNRRVSGGGGGVNKKEGGLDWKWAVIGGVALVCGLHSSALGKALIVGAGQRIARR